MNRTYWPLHLDSKRVARLTVSGLLSPEEARA